MNSTTVVAIMPAQQRPSFSSRGLAQLSRYSLSLVCTVVFLFVFPAVASAAPPNFWGLHFNGTFTTDPEDWEAIDRSGAEIYRLNASWRHVSEAGNWRQPGAWEQTYDKYFELATNAEISILPVLYGRKSAEDEHQFYLSNEWQEWLEFVTTFVQRYGRGGAFWDAHPNLGYRPVLVWEVWNEPNLPVNNPGGTQELPQKYAEFLVATSNAVHQAQNAVRNPGEPADTGILHGGLMQPAASTPESFIEKASKISGYGSSFFGLSIHPYTHTGTGPDTGSEAEKISEVVSHLGDARAALNKHGWKGKTLWITEMGWSLYPEHLNDEGEQSSLLRQSFDWLEANASAYKLQLVTWYFHRDIDVNHWAYHTGLRREDGSYRPAWWEYLAQTGAPAWPASQSPPNLGQPNYSREGDYSPGPRAIVDKFKTTHVFYRDTSGNLGHHWIAYGTENWGKETQTASVAPSSVPQAIVDGNGTIHVFYRDTSGNLGHHWIVYGGKAWNIETLGASPSLSADPRVVVDTNGTIHVFYRNSSGNLGQHWLVRGKLKWGAGTLSASIAPSAVPEVFVNTNGMLQVFYRDTSGNLRHRWLAKGSENWGQEVQSASIATTASPRVIMDPNGTLHVFYRNTAGNLGHHWIAKGTENWGKETQAASLSGDPRLISAGGALQVFYRNTAGNLAQHWIVYGTENWGKGSQTASISGDPRLISGGGALQVFYRNTAGNLGHHWIMYGTESWGKATQTAALASPPHLFDAGGALQVFFRNTSGNLGHHWHTYGTESWGKETQTASIAPRPPLVATGQATDIGGSSAKVHATVDAEGSPTDYYFEYGTTTAYGSKVPISAKHVGHGIGSLAVSEALSGLTPATTYHYRIVATSPEGIVTGGDKTLTTT